MGLRRTAVGEAELPDRLLQRHVAPPQIGAREGVAAQEQELEDHHRQPEGVVVGRARHRAQVVPLELGGRVGGHADLAEVSPLARLDLEAVAIDQFYHRAGGDQDVAVIDVAHHVARRVQHGQGAGQVARGVDEEGPGHLRKLGETALGAVEEVDRLVAGDLRHQQPGGAASQRAGEDADRPGRHLQQPLALLVDHRRQLLGFQGIDRLVVDLGGQLRRLHHREDRALAPLPQLGAEGDGPALLIVERRPVQGPMPPAPAAPDRG